MKNFETILSEAGIELTEEQKTSITKAVQENYKPVADWQNQRDKAKNLEEQLTTAKEALAKFDGVDAEALNQKIKDLTADLEQKDKDYQTQIADRDFQDMLKESIVSAKGKNAKAITALLDLDTLKASKNQKEDIATALKTLAEKEDSKMLFGDSEATPVETGNPIGVVTKGGNISSATDSMRAIMGLPLENTK